MHVFISWSGPRSLAVAGVLAKLIPDIIPAVDAFVSDQDLRKGGRWRDELSGALSKVTYGIVCLTPDNLTAPWILFEAGALSKSVPEGLLWTLLLDGLTHDQVTDPLSQFNHTVFGEREDVWKMITTMNLELGEEALPRDRLERGFNRVWPDIEREVSAVLAADPSGPGPVRSEREILVEVLDIARELRRDLGRAPGLGIFMDSARRPPIGNLQDWIDETVRDHGADVQHVRLSGFNRQTETKTVHNRLINIPIYISAYFDNEGALCLALGKSGKTRLGIELAKLSSEGINVVAEPIDPPGRAFGAGPG